MLRFILSSFYPGSNFAAGNLLLAGIVSLLTGFLIILVPEILIAFIASIFLLIGSALIYWSWKIKKQSNNPYEIKIKINE